MGDHKYALKDFEETRTKISMADEVDVNKIIERFMRTGMVEHIQSKPELYGDYTDVPSFHEALNLVRRVEEQFSGLSGDVKKRFNNNPEEFVAFVSDPENEAEAVKLGLLKAKSEPGSELPESGLEAPKTEAAAVPAAGSGGQ